MKKKTKKFIIEAEMEERWVPYVVGILNTMQYLGNIGGSRMLKFFSDGDGDFHPKFKIKGLKDKKGASGYFRETEEYIFDPDTVSEYPLYRCEFVIDCIINGVKNEKGKRILARCKDLNKNSSHCYWTIVKRGGPCDLIDKEYLKIIEKIK